MSKELYKKDVKGVLSELGVDPKKGLSLNEWKKRLQKYGYNEVVEKKEKGIIIFLKKFKTFSSIALEIIAIIYLLIHSYIPALIVIALVFINAFIAFMHEEKASEAVQMLKHKLQIEVRVFREGEWKTIPARELVPGDIIRIRAGDICPADIKIISDEEVDVDQSALTGESSLVSRGYGGIVYSGSVVRRGEANGVVIYTGANTYYGKTIDLIQTARPKLHIEQVTSRIITYLLIIVGISSALSLFIAYLYYRSFIPIVEYLLPLIISLLLFAVPVALPAMLTTTMAVGSIEMSRKGVIITRLSSIEDAASMSVLCSDKTGTLTHNKLSIVEVMPSEGFSDKDVISYGYMASRIENHDPIDLAFIYKAREEKAVPKFTLLKFTPFDPSIRRTEALVKIGNKNVLVYKGAVDTILSITKAKPSSYIANRLKELENKGYKAIAVAIKDHSWKLVGFVALYDYPRADTPKLIATLQSLGVRVKMLTGDALPVAKEIGEKIGIKGEAVRGEDIKDLFTKDPEKAEIVADNASIFAEIYPEDKFYIIKALQNRGYIVGMTGDGVNDSPSLKQAEVGIAVSNAVDVAKASASVVLTREGLGEIVDLVKVGRSVYQRVVTWILTKINKTLEIALFILATFIYSSIVLHSPIYILSGMDVILFFFLIDFFTISLSTDPEEGSQTPEVWNFKKMFSYAITMGGFTFTEMVLLLIIAMAILHIHSQSTLQSFFFLAITLFGVLMPFVFRTSNRFYKSPTSKTLILISIVDILVSLMLVSLGILMSPLPPFFILVIFLYSLFAIFVVNDNIKILLEKVGIGR